MIAPVNICDGGSGVKLGSSIHVAGKPEEVVAQDPNWLSNDCLVFINDISGYLNPWKFTFDPKSISSTGKASPVLPEPVEEEFGAPQWFLSRHGIGALSPTKAAFVSFRKSRSTLYICDIQKGELVEVGTPYAHIQYMHGDSKGKVIMLGQPADAGDVLTELTLDASEKAVLKSLSPDDPPSEDLPSSFISVGEYHALTLPPDGRTCHITYYPPKNPNYDGGLPGEKPPVVIQIHGGPFYMEDSNLDWSKQFFTSRGWAK